MATGQATGIIQHLRKAALGHDASALKDGELLEAFLARREEAALSSPLGRWN